jgi:hypothetical protein
MEGMRLLVWLSALLLGAAGCGISDTDHPAGESKIFEYTRSGGLAYSVYEVEIAADGSGVARFGTDPEELVEKRAPCGAAPAPPPVERRLTD